MLSVNCIICGAESQKPVCASCSARISEERPFLLQKSPLHGPGYSLESALDKAVFSQENIDELNSMAREAREGKRVSRLTLARAAILFHEKYSSYLSIFSLPEDYYLNLAEEFLSGLKGEKARYLLYRTLKAKGRNEEARRILQELAEKYGGKYARELEGGE